MCMSQQDVRNTVHQITLSEISSADDSYSPYEWNMLADAYISHMPPSVCAGMMDLHKDEVDRIYQLFSLRTVMSEMQKYLKQQAVTK